MNNSELESWVKIKLAECFADPSVAAPFMQEKRGMLNNKVYKYYPIHDDYLDDNGKTI